ncbi:Putative endoglucanase type K [Cytospora mali]|uniref:cellulase n=1 Tax=Cytospora mali TaxID=578113 RepID=A0A194W888_CYTMA|nr:Putative endoglucanase type K [Valsa mali]
MVSHWFLRLAAAISLPATTLAASGKGVTSRYWDCCKASCSWPGKAGVNQPVVSCDKDNVPTTDQNAENGCDSRSADAAFTCTDNAPWSVDKGLSFGFAATVIAGGNESDWCCACYQLEFTSGPVVGKTMIVQSTNTGIDLGSNQFDILIPGGGVGTFQNGCTKQFGQPFPGQPDGGVSSRATCGELPTQSLRNGCYWRFDWFKGANNPNVNFTQVRCPSQLTSRSGCKRDDDSTFPHFTTIISSHTSTKTTTNTRSTSTSRTASRSRTTSRSTSIRTTKTTSARTTGHTTTRTTSSARGKSTLSSSSSSSDVVPVCRQCGGQGWTGPTVCAAGSTCEEQDSYYSQCLPKGFPPPIAGIYERCGGEGWTGPTECISGTTCLVQNQYYSLCLPPDDEVEW